VSPIPAVGIRFSLSRKRICRCHITAVKADRALQGNAFVTADCAA
jgi:hypothetical protein